MYTSEDFPRIITRRNITITVNGSATTIKAEDAAYDKLLEAIKNEEWDEIPKLLSPKELVTQLSDGRLQVEGNQVYLKEEDGAEWPIPGELNQSILMHIERDLPLNGLVNFALNLRKNPSY
ncbi:MAG TPA: hypothetical protein VK982_16055, partial [Bacteroidales bacterium]|nr:hypothetical protein [Bacteroidales bacterium]